MTKTILIGITGTNGAGKGEVAKYLTEEYNFNHYSVREYIVADLKRRHAKKAKETYEREEMVQHANYLRANNGADYVVKQLHLQAQREEQHAVIESVRNPKEADYIHDNDGHIISIDADIKTRYERIKARKSSTDFVDFETFQAQEKKALKRKKSNEIGLVECMELADYDIINETGFEDLHQCIDEIIADIKNSA